MPIQGVVKATRKAESRRVRRPVSRVLSSPASDGWPFLWDARCRAPRATDPGGDAETPLPVARRAAPIWSCSRWGLPCRFRCRSRGGLLPHRFTLARPGEPGRRFVFCGTFPGVAPAGRYPAPCLRGARTFLTGRLPIQCSHPAVWTLAVSINAQLKPPPPTWSRRSASRARVSGSAMPSTRPGRKRRWKAATMSAVARSTAGG